MSTSQHHLKSVPTLRGLFNETKPTYTRDFMRENKQSLRQLQADTALKLTKDTPRPKWMPKLPETKKIQTRSKTNLAQLPPRRDGLQKSKAHDLESNSNTSVRHMAMQTEDIDDEEFLTNALKKCCSTETNTLMKRNSEGSVHGHVEESSTQAVCDIADQRLEVNEEVCSDNARITAAHAVPQNNQNSNVVCNEGSLSGRSNRTDQSVYLNTTSTAKKRDLGSRDELRLPRYLEIEKQERNTEIQRRLAIDPQCPHGYRLLSENERLQKLDNLKQKFDDLVSELNHMPMTKQTLRMHQRRAEIDKELAELECQLRAHSKTKVYQQN